MASLARAAVPWRFPAAAALLAIMLSSVLMLAFSRAVTTTPAPARITPPTAGLSRLPLEARGSVSAALGAGLPAYRVRRSHGVLSAENPAQRLNARFAASGVVFASAGASFGMRLTAAGYGGALRRLNPVHPRASANRVLYRHSGLSEWYANGPLGIEQGFDIARAPARGARGPLTLSLTLTGGRRASLAQDARTLTIDGAGAQRVIYGDLLATDATGRRLPSRLALAGGRLSIRVQTRGARFPLRVDPLVQQGAKLAGSGETVNGELGTSVALSQDGKTALVGGPGDEAMVGAAWVFTRAGSSWTQQGPKLTANDEQGEGQFGISVALSADGSTALIGGINDETAKAQRGAAWVFTRAGSSWTQQGPKLTANDEAGNGRFGRSAALSLDGSTALVGGYFDNTNQGAAWVFTRSGSSWTQQGPKLTANDEQGEGQFGFSVALSDDAATALIGGPSDEAGKGVLMTGAAWVFTRSGSSWTQQGSKLTGAAEQGPGEFGASVALSGDGGSALVGGPADGGAGAAWAFTRSGAAWAQQGPKLTAADATSGASFGAGVALSDDDATALIGGPVDKGSAVPTGAAWEFARSGSLWTQQGSKLQGGGWAPESEFGLGVALSGDGDTALVGGPIDAMNVGAAWAFVDPPAAVTTLPASSVEATGAVLNGTVAAGPSSTAYFEYGATPAYGVATPVQALGRSGGARAIAAPVSGLLSGETLHYRLVAVNSAGVSSGGDQTLTTNTFGGKQAFLPPPTLSAVAEAHRVWRDGTRGASIARRRSRAPLGTAFSFSLDQAASVTLTFTQAVHGRRVGHRCLAQSRHNRRRPSCRRVLTRGSLVLPGHPGHDRVAFQGVLSRGRKLGPGSYAVRIGAINAAGRSQSFSLSFAIVRR